MRNLVVLVRYFFLFILFPGCFGWQASTQFCQGQASAGSQASKPIPIYDRSAHKTNFIARPKSHRAFPMDTTSNGSSCTLITFEGLGDLQAIPTFYGISLPDWLSIIQDTAGGSGNFANAPSGVTIAFWLDGNPTSQSINIPNGASQISLYYSSYYAITLSAYDASGNLLTTVSGDPNFDTDTDVYDVWSPLTINAPSGTSIASLAVAGYANYTGIDNLNVCQSPQVAAAEVTQAIQQYQTLADLKSSLKANGEPPVPIIAGKPAVLRTYMNPVQAVTNVTIHLTGVTDQTKSVAIQPNCPPADQRSGSNGCQSIDFYFTPPSGSWTATLDVLDSSGNVLEEESLPITSRSTDSLLLQGVSVCDAQDSNNNWLCGNASDLLGHMALISKIAPSSSITAQVSTSAVQRDSAATYTACPPDSNNNKTYCWWDKTVQDIAGLYGWLNAVADFATATRTTYFGVIRNVPSGGTDYLGGTGGIASGIPSHAAMGRTSALRFASNTETNVEVVAHETGHTLGLKHTNTDNPPSDAAPPGCYNFAGDSTTDWFYPTGTAASAANTNYLQSSAQSGSPTYETGFDVSSETIIDPTSTFEVMSYCSPRWISPQRYKTMISTLGGGTVSSPSVKPRHQASPKPQATTTPQPFWIVSGTIQQSSVTFNPLFQVTAQGDTSAGSGTYSLQEQDAKGNVLFTRMFTPESSATETTGKDIGGTPAFSQLIPVTANTSAIVVLGPGNTELGHITMSGTAPTVSITSPGTGFTGTGTQKVAWTVQGPSTYSSIVLYSANNGTTWVQVGKLQNATSTNVDFDLLPGSTQALIEVLVSDGVNTGSATSAAFTVPAKKPSVVQINSPANNFSQPAANPLYLSGSVYDIDDGVLSGSALKWSDDVAGDLGTGSPLTVTLKAGTHNITLTGTDADGNSITATAKVVLGGQPPAISIQGQALNEAPTTCEFATISATPGANQGAPLSLVQYSVDGGTTYTTVPLTNLPYGFLVPGSGFLHLVARAYDISGQSNATDTTFFIQSACNLTTQTITFGALSNQIYGVAPINLSAKASSGLPVTYSVTGPAKVSGSVLTISGVGTVTVTAMQTGNSTYAPASWVSHSFTVSAATPTISWTAPAAITYGATLSGILNAAAANGQTSVPGAFIYTAQSTGSPAAVTAATMLPAGTYTLEAQFTPTDDTDYNTASKSVTLIVNKAAATITLASSGSTALAQSTVTLMTKVTSTISTPTGTVNFLDGSTTLGSAMLSSGEASYSTSALTSGNHSITAVYSGDTNFDTVTSSALTQDIVDFSVSAAAGSSTQTVNQGAAATYSLTVAPVGGNTIPAAISLSATGLPTGATAAFSPASIAAGSASTTVTMTVQTPAKSESVETAAWGAGGSALLCLLLLPLSRRIRLVGRQLRMMFTLAILIAAGVCAMTAITGCGGGGKPKPQDFTITVNAASGSLTHSTTVALTID